MNLESGFGMKVLIRQTWIQKKDQNSNCENNLEEDKSKIEEITSFQIHKVKIKQNRKEEKKLYGEYVKMKMRKQKLA